MSFKIIKCCVNQYHSDSKIFNWIFFHRAPKIIKILLTNQGNKSNYCLGFVTFGANKNRYNLNKSFFFRSKWIFILSRFIFQPFRIVIRNYDSHARNLVKEWRLNYRSNGVCWSRMEFKRRNENGRENLRK